MHAQKATVHAVIDTGHDYCISVKKNQQHLLKKIEVHVERAVPRDSATTVEKDRNRTEVRSVEVYASFYGARRTWYGLRSIVKISRVRRVPSKSWHEKRSMYDTSIEIAYYISSMSPDTSAAVLVKVFVITGQLRALCTTLKMSHLVRMPRDFGVGRRRRICRSSEILF